MVLRKKVRVLELIDTVLEMLSVIPNLNNQQDALRDCREALQSIRECFEKEDISKLFLDVYNNTDNMLCLMSKEKNNICDQNIQEVCCYIEELKKYIQDKVEGKIKIVFLPYKAEMWDSLDTIYRTAIKDKNCEVKVVPIPYYELEKNSTTLKYEGERFPKEIPMVRYDEYKLEVEQPDIIFVHNIYDEHNTVTQVLPAYFTYNLRKYTDMLVYVPYHISSPIKDETLGGYAYSLSSVKYVDKVVLCADFVEQDAIKFGIEKEKLLTLGSPKFDGIYNYINSDQEVNIEWKNVIVNKKVVLFTTGCMYFVQNPIEAYEQLALVLDMIRYSENLALIWRPHPLTRACIKRYCPTLLDKFDRYYESIKKQGYKYSFILDDNPSYYESIKIADVLITGEGSILDAYMLTEKAVLFIGDKMPDNYLLPENVFYYFYSEDELWYEFIKKFDKGYDPLANNRKDVMKKLYKNLDGTCGAKVFNAIKESVVAKIYGV